MADAEPISLGQRLKQERELHHWTQEELADKIGGSVPSINRWEHDRTVPRAELLTHLTEVFGRPPERWGMAREVYWNVPFLRNPYFTGREQVLQRLHRALAAEQTVALSQARAISGLGGIGKTQIAVEYAYRYANEYEAVLWVRADTAETLLSDFAALATVLELPAQQESDQHYVVSMVKRWLGQHSPWLLIFDNADDPTLVIDMLPRRVEGAILLTTRSQVPGAPFTKIGLEKLSREEGITFLLRRLTADGEERSDAEVSQQEREAAEQLWQVMDGLPLALDQAAAYIEETEGTLSDYLALFKTSRKQLLALRGQLATAYPASVATTWLLSFEKVQRANAAAAELLYACAFLHPDEIPEAMLRTGAAIIGARFEAMAAEKVAWDQTIGELRKYSMVKRDAERKMLTMHRLVQTVIKDGMHEATAQVWVERVVQVVNMAFPLVVYENWLQCESLLPHALTLSQLIEQYQIVSKEAGHLLHKAATYLYERARYQEAEPLYQRVLHIREQQLGLEHPEVAQSLNSLAMLYWEQGKYIEAEQLYQRALHIREQQLGPEHPEVAQSLNGLASLYEVQGKYAEAEPLYQQALYIREQQLGPDHPEVAQSLNGLADLYREQGKYEQAEPLCLRALHIREQQLGPEHPLVAHTLSTLAGLYWPQGKYAEAEPLQQRALHIHEQQLGLKHPAGAYALNGLAILYHLQGKYEQAELLYQRAVHVREQQLGPEHPDVVYPLINLAELYREQGKYAEAELLYQRTLYIWEQHSMSESAYVAHSFNGLANLYVEQGKYEQAESLFLQALRIREMQLNPEHPDIAETLHSLAQLRERQGNSEEARTWYTRALAIREQALGANHPETMKTRTGLIALLHTIGQYVEE